MRALPKMPFDTIIRYFLVFMEIGSWLKTQVSLLVNTSMALLQAKYKVDVTGSASEVIRSALRLLENQETKLQSLRQLLVEGEQSGDADYDLDSFINELDSENIR